MRMHERFLGSSTIKRLKNVLARYKGHWFRPLVKVYLSKMPNIKLYLWHRFYMNKCNWLMLQWVSMSHQYTNVWMQTCIVKLTGGSKQVKKALNKLN